MEERIFLFEQKEIEEQLRKEEEAEKARYVVVFRLLLLHFKDFLYCKHG